MSLSRSGKPDPDLEGVELLYHQRGGSASFGTKMTLSLNGVDPSCVDPLVDQRAQISYMIHCHLANGLLGECRSIV